MGAIALVSLFALAVQPVSAVPADPDRIFELRQPDGSAFAARLIGDETAHWYETEAGHTILRDSDGFWVYAESASDGSLVRSDRVAGVDAPPGRTHLRQDPDLSRRSPGRSASSGTALRAPTLASIIGAKDAVIILVEFDDTLAGEGSGGAHDAAYFGNAADGLILGSSGGNLADYLDEVSYGQLALGGVVANGIWHRSDKTELYFGEDSDPGQPCDLPFDVPTATDNTNTCISDLVRNAVQMADTTGFDFSPYDGDLDGIVDHVIVVHAGHNQGSLGGSIDDIWSHWGIVPGGGEIVDGVAVENYVMISEHDAMSVLAHEFMHDLGAPDLYDYDLDSDPVGRWCNMGYNFESSRPPHPCGLLKVDIDADFGNGMTGWLSPTLLSADGTYSVNRLDQTATDAVFMTDPAFSGQEYFLVENRSQAGYYDSSVPESGLIITHVDMAMPDGVGRFNDGTPQNAFHGAWIERPLNLASSDGAAFSSDDAEVQFTPTSIPNTNANGDVGTGDVFWGITAEAASMDFQYRADPTVVSGTTSGYTEWTVDHSPYVVTGDLVVADGDTLLIEPGVIVKFNGGDSTLIVYGTLIAEGTPTDRIIFTSYADDEHGGDTNGDGPGSGSPGQWEGIVLDGADSPCPFANCLIRYAGNQFDPDYDGYTAFWASLQLRNASVATMDSCHVEYCFFFNNTYGGYMPTAIYAGTDCSLTLTDCDIVDNGNRGVSGKGALTFHDCRILRNGWQGILSYGAGTDIQNCQVLDNGSQGILTYGNETQILNSRITGNGDDGINIQGSLATVVADTVSGNGDYGIYLPLQPTDFSDNIVTSNTGVGLGLWAGVVTHAWTGDAVMSGNGVDNAIWVYEGTIGAASTWIDEHVYAVQGDIIVADGITWSLEPGTVMKFNGVDIGIHVYGTMIAVGTDADRIVFTSFADDDHGGDTNGNGLSTGSPGQWETIGFNGADSGCNLSHCLIRYAGNVYDPDFDGYVAFWSAIAVINASSLTMTSCVVEHTMYSSNTYGGYMNSAIYSGSNCSLEMSDCDIVDNGNRGISTKGDLIVHDCRILRNGWEGVLSYGAGSDIRNCLVAYNGNDGMNLQGTNAVVIADSLLGNGDHGMLLYNLPATFQDCVAADNLRCGYVLPTQIMTEAWHSGNYLQTGDAVGVWAGDIPAGTTWIDEHPVNVYGDLNLPHDNDLTLEPGTVLKFANYYGLTVRGILVANGTSSDNIVFTAYADDDHGGDTNGDGPSSGSRAYWRNITFTDTNPGCSMQYCLVRWAGRYHGSSNYYREAVVVTGTGELTMTDCVIEETGGGSNYPYALRVEAGADFQILDSAIHDNSGYGVWIAEPTALITGCSSDNNGIYGFHVHPELVGEVAAVNSFSGNGWDNTLSMMDGSISVDDSWPNSTIYAVNGTVTIDSGATLILEKGVTLKINGNRSFNVNGGLYAQGDAVEKVVFTSFKDDNYGGDTNLDGVNTIPAAGDWGGINLDGAHAGSLMGWAVVAYGGYGGVPAIRVDNTSFTGDFTECIVRDNLGRGVQVGVNGDLTFTNCDLYGNGYGLENLNTSVMVDARGNWWGDPSGPSGVGPGSGDAVSNYVLYDPWLSRSIDNPWVAFTSPSTSGNYTDVLIFDLDEDPLLDVVAGTESGGLEVYLRTGFETWSPAASPITSGQILSLERGDFNDDGHQDLLVCGPTGLRVFAGDGAAGFTEAAAPISGPGVSDAKFAYVDHDANLDIVACSADNGGVWIFYGNGAGYWSTGNRPAMINTYNKVSVGDLNNDTWLDIVATSAEYLGVHTWYGAADSTWTAGAPILEGSAFFGLDLGDIDKDGNFDIAAGSDQSSVGIVIYLGDGAGAWTPLDGPTTTGRFGDLRLADLNGDGRLDLAASNLFEGINVWIGTSALKWNYWYHPASTNIYKAICVDDFTLNGSLDLAGASTVHGLAMWDNLTPGFFQEYYALDPDQIDFGRVAIGNCAHENFDLTNATVGDTLRNVVVYTTNEAFTVSAAAKEVGPFDMLPGETVSLQVSYCPLAPVAENEVIIVHSTQSVTHLRVTGEGIGFIEPIWAVNLDVANALGGPGNSQTLTFGAAIGATDTLDIQSGEIGLPPTPPSNIFDTRFQIPGTEGSLVNIHDYYNITDVFTFQWQAGDGDYPVTVNWDPGQLPAGTFLIGTALKDTLDMALNTEYLIPVEMPYITELTIWSTVFSSHTHDLHDSWQLVSRPIATDSDSLTVLFPNATSAFRFAGNYQQTDLIAVGEGYWLDMPAAELVTHTGDQVRRIERTLPAGWSLIGAPYDTFTVANIAQTPPGVIQSVYGFDVAYYLASELLPGQGFWVDMQQAGTITIDMDAFKAAPAGDWPAPVAAPANWEMILSVLPSGRDPVSAILLGCGATDGAGEGLDRELGELRLPPRPPTGIFDVRLALAGGIGVQRDLRSPDADRFVYNLNFQGGAADFPLRLSWDPGSLPPGASAVLTDAVGGRLMDPVDMRTGSEAVIGAEVALAGGLMIEVSLTGETLGVPKALALHANVPNPFNPSTTIHFDLPRTAKVDLDIFDVAGRRVRSLVSTEMPAGRHEVEWNGRNGSGAAVASGSYFYRLKVGNDVLTHKMLLIK